MFYQLGAGLCRCGPRAETNQATNQRKKDFLLLSRRLKLGSAAVIVLAALSLSATSANAGVLVSSAPNCSAQPLSTPFSPWLDFASYTPVLAGDFESSAAGWALSGGAAVANGSETFNVSGDAGASSLTIPGGGSATSPVMCVGLEHPTLRFFAKRNTGGLLGLSTLRVDVLFESSLGLVSSLPIGAVTATGTWQPSLPMTVLVNLMPLLSGDHTPVQFRFVPMLGGSWSVDDVYVDPYNRN